MATGCTTEEDAAAIADGLDGKVPQAALQALVGGTPTTLIVALSPAATLSIASGAAASGDVRAAWADAKQRLLDDATGADLVVERTWDHLPLVQVRVASLDAAAALLARPELGGAFAVEAYPLLDAESFALIHQREAAAAGARGAGTSVAVLDTGADYRQADLGACTSPGQPASCRVAVAMDFAAQDNALDANGHGTNVSAIVAGVAPATQILALDVFSGEAAYNTDILSAINWTIANRAAYRIAALNLSLGGGSSTTPCGADALAIALGAARDAGIAPVVAAGNAGLSNALASPACAPAAISVGAVYDNNVGGIRYGTCQDATTAADQVTCFSSSASFLTVLAPGALITAGGTTMAGTSQAAPHVAGAMAVLRAAFPADTVTQLVARLTATGKPIRDPRNGVVKPRLDLAAAIGTASADTTPPTGSVVINAGAVATSAPTVTLAISATDASGVDAMCVTNATTCTTFQPYASSVRWTLADGQGAKKVTVVLRDRVGNATPVAISPSAMITLDTIAPSNGSVTATPDNAAIRLTWTGFADAGSGIRSYRVVGGAVATPPATCAGTAIYEGAAPSFTHGGLSNGTAYSYRVCAVDVAGNGSTGTGATAAPRPESVPPTGKILLDGGAPATRSATVTLTLIAVDPSGVTAMCIGDGSTCAAFVPYVATASYTFAAGDGTRKLSAWYRDRWGNTSAPVAATIVLDTTAPTGGALAATADTAAIALTWTPGADALSGVAEYRLIAASGSAPPVPGCAAGTRLAGGTITSFRHAVAAQATWSYRLCVVDGAGNVSAGTTKTITAR